MTVVRIYTDGACSGNQKKKNLGGWGAVLEYGSFEKQIFGSEKNTTNNRMELTAVLEAFRALKKDNLKIEVFSDSAYLADCFRKRWYENWLAKGRLHSGGNIANPDLWLALLPFLEKHEIRFFRVKGHLNLDSPSTDVDSHFRRFREWNGEDMSFDFFKHVVARNHEADALANKGIDQLRN